MDKYNPERILTQNEMRQVQWRLFLLHVYSFIYDNVNIEEKPYNIGYCGLEHFELKQLNKLKLFFSSTNKTVHWHNHDTWGDYTSVLRGDIGLRTSFLIW